MKQVFLIAAVLLLTGCGLSEAEVRATAVVVEAGQTAIAAAAVAATEAADTCSPTKLRTYGARIERELEVYDGLLSIAGSTGRIALAGPRQELQKQRFVIKDIETPECLTDYHDRVLQMMEMQEKGYEYFVSDTSDTGEFVAANFIAVADKRLAALKLQLATILDGQVPVLPPEELEEDTSG